MASRKEAKEQARERRLAEEAARAATTQRKRRMQMLGGVVVVAVAIVAVLIAVSSGGGSGTSGAPKTKAAQTTLVDSVTSLLNGIPQSGTELGNPSAPVTMSYFGDLECPVCAAFTTGADGGGLSQFISNQVKAGKVKIIYRSFCTATCNDEGQTVFNTQQAAAYAAGLQKKFWDYTELFYHEQGAEGSGYVTPTFLNGLASQIPGLNYSSWQTGRSNPNVVNQVNSDQQLAAKMQLTGTPTVIFKGPKGEAQAGGSIPTYSSLQQAFNQVD
ncbi:MAG TPA: thioredoxin domain-containing protein [Solirubrobacteraceae bacterium]|jgi:protein-disulfide isomerase|nr:thioredoxin domain-containing protein [Solirubrobacteraceae bacterium]